MEMLSSSYGVHSSTGIDSSTGVSNSNGVSTSYGVSNSNGINEGIFVNNIKTKPKLFNKEISEERFNEVFDEISNLSNGWKPTYNNLKSLYLKNGSKWECIPIHKAKGLSKKEAWSGMPKELLEYIKSLPEFDAGIFEEITGIK